MIKKFFIRYSYLFLIFICFIFVTLPLFHGGFFPTMDDVQVVRIDMMTRELLAGQFPVRIINQFANGAGYMLFNFYGTLPYYIGAFYHLLGLPLVRATKFVFLTGYLLGGIGIYFLIKSYTDKLTATLCTVLFLTATYVNYDVYTRGSLGEFFGFMTLPLLFWSFLRLTKKVDLLDISIAGCIYAASVISHPLTAVMGSIFLGLLVIVSRQKEVIIASVKSILLGLLLGAFSWLPVALEQKNLSLTTNVYETTQYLTNFLSPLQLAGILHIGWGIRSPLLGMGLFIGAILGAVVVFWRKNKYMHIGLFALISFVVSLFMISSLSKVIWDMNAYIRLVQFPWRYLVITTISAIMLIGFLFFSIKRVWLRVLLGVLLLIPAITIQYQYLRPASYNYIAVYTADDICNTSTWAQEYLPKWVKQCITKKTKLPLVSSQQKSLAITNIQVKKLGNNLTFDSTGTNDILILKKYYFPGWEVIVDGKKLPTFPYGTYGLLAAHIPVGKHKVQVEFTNTLPRTIGNFLSLLGIVIVIIIILKGALVPSFYRKFIAD